jgi:hypothetical protein
MAGRGHGWDWAFLVFTVLVIGGGLVMCVVVFLDQ